MWLKRFLLNSKNEDLSGIIWNMAGNFALAFQSVFLLMIITRVIGLEDAGIFTFAYANANMFMMIGNYGMRNFQVSDVNKQFQFPDYFLSRVFSTGLMLIISTGYILYTSAVYLYSPRKILVLIWMCLFKAVDAMEDVFHGFFQGNGRLDVAAKALTMRVSIVWIVFGISLILFRDLLFALIVSTTITGINFIVFTRWDLELFKIPCYDIRWKHIGRLFGACFPLFAGAFLSFYIGNAPKYAIDAYLTSEQQACYGFIVMPVNIVGVLNGFIFSPVIYKISVLFYDGKIKEFISRIVCQMGIIALLAVICMAGGYLLGIPVLSWLYFTDLAEYKSELLILLLGGGFLGLSGLLNVSITIMRFQKSVIWGYAVIALLAAILSGPVVKTYGIMGAAVLYTVLMAVLCLIFGILFMYGIIMRRRKRGISEG